MSITLTGDTLVLDESSGLQNSGIPTSTEDNNDDDVGFATLHSGFAARLFNPVISGGLALDNSFAQDKGVAIETVINISAGTTVTGFLDGSDNPLLAYQSGVTDPTTGVETSFTTLDGEKIYLFIDQDSGLGDMMTLGVAANGDIVFAAFLNPGATSADIWMVQFEPISNPDASDPDDPVDLSGLLNVGAATPLSFHFNALPSGQNLFGMVGPSATAPAIIVIGKDIVLKADGTFANGSNTINTSQGGGPTTIGVNNQMFNPGEGAYFSYVNNPVANFLSGAPGGLNQNEADDADNIQYTGGTNDVTSAFFVISQLQAKGAVTVDITTYLAAGDTGRNFVNSLGDGASPDIVRVKVYNAAGTLIEDTGDLSHFNSPTVNVTGLGTPTARVSGLGTGYKVEWITDADHNQVLIKDVAGKFDIGGFGISEGQVTSVPVGDKLIFEDDGPTVVRSADPVPTLTVDDSDFVTNDSASFAGLFTANFGTDGAKDSDNNGNPDADATTYALGVSAPDADSGLVDTLTNEKVVLNLNGTDVVGTTETGGVEVFRITVDASGNVTLDQSRAVVHDDPTDPDEASSPATLAAASLVTLTATVTDNDGDTDAQTADIGDAFAFKDDGPAIDRSEEAVPTLTVDDSDFGTDDSASFAGLFTAPDFGADGPKDSDDDDVPDADAVAYTLGVSGPDADSGLVDTLTNEKVVLNLVGTDVVGTTETGGLEVFRITVDASGNVTLDQSRAVVHDDPTDPDEAASPAVLAAASLVTLTATVTDGDGDTDAATADIGDAFQFKDDGPAIDRSEEGVPTLTVDDSDFGTDDSASFAGLFTAPDFGADGPKDADDNDVPDDDAVSYALGVSGPDADSGLVDTLTNEKVVLNLVGADVVGTTETGGLEVFRITVDASGNVTLDQSRAVVHDDPLDPDEAASPAVLSAANLVTLTATITDGDGDTDAATADIGDAFQFKDDGPSIIRSADPVPLLTVDDSDFGTDDSASFAGLFTPDFGADGPKDSDDDDVPDTDATTYALGVSGPDADSGLIDTLTNEKVVLNLVGTDVVGTTETTGLEVLRISVDGSGTVTLDQSRAVVHDDPLDPDESTTPAVLAAASLVTLTATITDGDGDTDAVTADIGDAFQFKDDGPAIDPADEVVPTLTVDDSDLVTNATLSFAALFSAPAFGADGPKDGDNNDVADTDAITYALDVNGSGLACGIFDTLTGEAVVLDKVGNDIVGTTETTGLEVFRISVDAAGNVTLDQSRAVVHDDPTDPDEASSPAVFNAADLVTLTATIVDGDGDIDTATVDISAAFQFKDDGPAVGPISDDLVDFVTGSSASNLLGAVEGADGAAATITDFTPSVTYDFGTLLGELSGDGKTVIYFQDVGGGVGIFDDGIDVKFFTLAVDDSDTDAANWDYTFTVHQDAPPASLEFDFDSLASGQNLFGTVGPSSTDPAIIVIGRDIVLNADGTYDNSSDTINTSQGGGPTTIGINNQMFDAGEGAYFSYVDDPVANFLSGAPGGLDQNEADDADNIQYTGGTVDVTSAFFIISQIQGNTLATADVTTYFLGTAETGTDFVDNLGNGTSPDIIRVKVYDENGNLIEDTGDLSHFDDATVVITGIGDPTVRVAGLDAGYKVEWVTDGEHNQSLVEGVAGKFDIGLFGISEPTPTPDKELDFTVAITDFDGDVEEDTFTIGIDGNHDGSINIV